MVTPCPVCSRDSSPLRWACPACVRDTRWRLDEIQHHTIVIGTVGILPTKGALDGLPRSGGFGPREPVNLDKLAALDYRSHIDGTGDDDDPHEPTLSIPRSLHQLATYVHERRLDDELHDIAPRVEVSSLAVYLRVHTEWCAHQRWGDEFVRVVQRLHAQTRRQAHDAPPQPLGRCLTPGCGGTVWPTQRGGRCSEPCRDGVQRVYDGLDLQRLAGSDA